MKVDDLILQLQDLINDSKTVPLSGGKVMVSSDEVYDIIEQIQDAMPAEVRHLPRLTASRRTLSARLRNARRLCSTRASS